MKLFKGHSYMCAYVYLIFIIVFENSVTAFMCSLCVTLWHRGSQTDPWTKSLSTP